MVKSVNGDRGSSVIPIGGDDYMFLGRGHHVVLDNGDVKYSGSSGASIIEGIEASGNGKLASIRATSASMKLMSVERLDQPDEYLLICDKGWII